MEAPPSRYRVVERGGRLVVIDSAVGGTPLTARDLLPDMASDDGSDAPTLDRYPREGVDPELQAAPLATLDPRLRGDTQRVARVPARPPAAPSMIAEPPGALRSVAETVAGGKRDGDGRLRWNTARWFDSKGPRTVTLSDNAERQLGFAVLTLVAAAIVAVFLVILGGVIGWVIVFFAVVALRQMKPGTTAWIDRIARQ